MSTADNADYVDRSTSCPHCGTLTGIHGFSFGKDGKYATKKTEKK